MRKLLLGSTALFALWGCSGGDGGTGSTVATTVSITPNPITLDAIGATQKVHASVLDQKGRAMTGVSVAWASSAATVSVSPLGGDSAMVTAVSAGPASITATVGSATGTAQAPVNQVPAAIQVVSGNNQQAAPGATLGVPVLVRVLDRLGHGVGNTTVTFTVNAGSGTVSSQTVTTAADGTASVNWTLGAAAGQQTITASTVSPALTTVITAIATNIPAGTTGMSPVRGGEEAVMIGTATTDAPTVRLMQGGAPMAGVTVTFTPEAGGSVTGATVVTNAQGEATVGSWTVTGVGPTRLIATAASTGYTPVVFAAYGCEGGGGAGYAITLCLTTPMTAGQRAAFENAAARWGGVITGDLSNVSDHIAAGECDDATPAVNFNIDDLVIFAAVIDIDGAGAVLGRAGPCFIRDVAPQLSLMGVMEFDAADMASLESGGGLGSVITHEMGHVLGIGAGIWNLFGLLQDPSPSSGAPKDTWYSGANGIAGFDAIGGTGYTTGKKVPVENTGGPGTANSHWRESVLKNELMTGYLNNGSNPLSLLTARSLQDLGYVVDPSKADAFSISGSAIQGNRTGTGTRLDLGDDVRHGPVYRLGRNGRRTRVQ